MEKGRAVEEAWAQTKRLRMKVEVKRKPGKRRAVMMVLRRQFVPPKVL